MSFSLLHKLVAYLLSGLGLLSLSLGNEMSEPALLLILLGYVTSFFAEGELLRKPGYSRGWTALVVGFLLIQLVRALADAPTLAMAMEFAAVLQISRLFNRREAADYQQIAVLSFLHLIAATVLSTSLSYALIFIGFVIATPWMLALSHLRREIEGNYPAAAEGGDQAQAAIRRVLASKRVVGPSFLLGTALLALPLFAMTLTIFVMIPRVGKGFLTFQRDSGQRVAGFGNQVELGGFGVIRDDPTVVLRVTPLPRVDEKAPRLSLRMRGTSFDRYDGRRWMRTPSTALPVAKGMPRYRTGSHLYPLRRWPKESDRRFQIVLDHLDEPVLFLPAGAVALEVPPRVVDSQRHRRPLSRSVGFDIRYEDRDGLGLIYTAFVSSAAEDAVLPPFTDEPMARYLEVPPGHERVAALARRVAGSATDDTEKAERIERFLKRGEYRYSLQQPKVGDKNPLDVFLFEAKRGHCEYYSSAMAIMLRTLGIPTRNVTGFVGGRYNPYGGYYALRQGDAHSWVEAQIADRGWVTFDPTPASRAAAGPAQTLWADINAFIDAMRTRWMRSVVGYDLESQRSMVMRLYRWLKSRSADEQTASSQVQDGRFEWRGMWRIARVPLLLLLLGAAVFAYYRFRGRRSHERGRQPPPRVARAVDLYVELERALQRRGLQRPPSRTPHEHARLLRDQGFAHSAEVRAVTDRYVEVRYGEAELSPQELAELRVMVKRVRDSAPQARPPHAG